MLLKTSLCTACDMLALTFAVSVLTRASRAIPQIECLPFNAINDRSAIRASCSMTGVQSAQGSRLRPLFNVYHRWTGRSAAGLAIANVFIGLHVAGEALKFYWCAAVL